MNTPNPQGSVPSQRLIYPVFLGGTADSGKSDMMAAIASRRSADVQPFSISAFFRSALADDLEVARLPRDEMGSEVALIDWKSSEQRAVQQFIRNHDAADRTEKDGIRRKTPAGLPVCIKENRVTAIINTHFATYSAGGFMMGLDPPSLREICEACKLISRQKDAWAVHPQARAAVVLVDIGIGDVLHRREANWTTKVDAFTAGAALIQDLEFNRLFALQYFNVLTGLLTPAKVFYKRVFIDYKERSRLVGSPVSIAEFKDGVAELEQWLEDHQFVRKQTQRL